MCDFSLHLKNCHRNAEQNPSVGNSGVISLNTPRTVGSVSLIEREYTKQSTHELLEYLVHELFHEQYDIVGCY